MKNSAFSDFSEGAMEQAYEAWDFKTCQRDNGSIYGIPDKSSCQTGKEVSATQGDNAMTNMRMATGRDARKLDVDVMQFLGPEALAKIYADNWVSGATNKQDVLAQKAKARLLGIREGEIDVNQGAGGLMGGLGRKFAETLANSVFVGETTQAQDKSGTGILAFMIQSDLKDQIEETGLSFSVGEIEDGIEGVQQLLSNPEDRDIVVKQLERLGIGGMNNLGSDVFSAGKVAALVGGMTKEKGMTAQEMMVHGMDVLVTALRDATRRAETKPFVATPEQVQAGVDALKDAIDESPVSERETEAVQEEERRKRIDEMAAQKPKSKNYPVTYIDKKGKQEHFGITMKEMVKGVYEGIYSDGYVADYQFAPNGQANIVSYLPNGTRDVTRAKYEVIGSGSLLRTLITSKTGNKTVIPTFRPNTMASASDLETPTD